MLLPAVSGATPSLDTESEFTCFDLNGDGVINDAEFEHAVGALDIDPNVGAAKRNGLRTRKHRRPVTQTHRRAVDQLWRGEVMRWLESIGGDTNKFKKLSLRDKNELTAWFNALDMDGSGSVEEDEINALMDAMGVPCSRKLLVQLFASIDKPIDAELTMPVSARQAYDRVAATNRR